MSILFMDNFQNYGTGVYGDGGCMLDGVYASGSNDPNCVTDPDGVSGTRVLRLFDTGSENIRKVLPNGPETTLGIHFRLWMNTLPGSNGKQIIVFNNAANQINLGLALNSTGTLSIIRGSTVLTTTSIPVITASAWWHIEIKVVFSQTVGSVEVRVNEETKISLSEVDTCNTADEECSQFLLSNGINANCYMKDLIVWNGDGSVNNDFMGDWKVVSTYTDGDVALNWTPSTGSTGYNLLTGTTPDDTTYIQAGDPPPSASEFSLNDLDPDVTEVAGVQTFVRATKTDSGTGYLQVSLKSNGDIAAGADRPITVAETYWMDIFELDPDTGTAWTRSSYNNATILIDRTI